LRLSDICRGRRLDVVWTRCLRLIPALSFLYRSHLEGSQAGRSSRSAADEVRAGHQSQDRQGAWPPNSRQAARHRRRGDRMKRRTFITLLGGGAAAWPLAVRAQQPSKLPMIGDIGGGTPSTHGQLIAGFVQRLRELGWIEDRTVAIEIRWAEGRNERYTEIAAEFIRRKVDVILTSGAAVPAAKQATSVIPIVFSAANDAVGAGFGASLARPGGNITGLSMQNTDSASKRLELLREVVVGLRRLAILTNVSYGAAVAELREAHATARASGLEVITLEIQRSEDVAPPFAALNDPIGALYVCSDPLTLTNRIRINTLALSARLPTIYGLREFVEAGGLISYGPNFPDLFRRSASYVDKILRGTKPADIPVEQPT